MVSNKEKISVTDIEIERINDFNKPILSNFKSYEKELVDFLVEDALNNKIPLM